MLPTYIFTRIISNGFLSSSVMPFFLFFIFVVYVILNCTNCICVFDRREKIKSLEVSLLATLSISEPLCLRYLMNTLLQLVRERKQSFYKEYIAGIHNSVIDGP